MSTPVTPLDLHEIEGKWETSIGTESLSSLVLLAGQFIPALIARIRHLESQAPASPAPEAVKLVDDLMNATESFTKAEYRDPKPHVGYRDLMMAARNRILIALTPKEPQGAEARWFSMHDSVTHSRLGQAALQAGDPTRKDVGDSIDRGLILQMILREKGYTVVPNQDAPSPGAADPLKWTRGCMPVTAKPREALDKLDRAYDVVSELCQGTRRWTMSVPARPDYDPDLVIAGALRAAATLIRELSVDPEEGART